MGPFHNRSHLFREAMASVLRQTRQPEEIVVVNDGSRPEEAAVLIRAKIIDKTIRDEAVPQIAREENDDEVLQGLTAGVVDETGKAGLTISERHFKTGCVCGEIERDVGDVLPCQLDRFERPA